MFTPTILNTMVCCFQNSFCFCSSSKTHKVVQLWKYCSPRGDMISDHPVITEHPHSSGGAWRFLVHRMLIESPYGHRNQIKQFSEIFVVVENLAQFGPGTAVVQLTLPSVLYYWPQKVSDSSSMWVLNWTLVYTNRHPDKILT